MSDHLSQSDVDELSRLRLDLADAHKQIQSMDAQRDELRAWVSGLSRKGGCWQHGDKPEPFCPNCGKVGAVIARAEEAENRVSELEIGYGQVRELVREGLVAKVRLKQLEAQVRDQIQGYQGSKENRSAAEKLSAGELENRINTAESKIRIIERQRDYHAERSEERRQWCVKYEAKLARVNEILRSLDGNHPEGGGRDCAICDVLLIVSDRHNSFESFRADEETKTPQAEAQAGSKSHPVPVSPLPPIRDEVPAEPVDPKSCPMDPAGSGKHEWGGTEGEQLCSWCGAERVDQPKAEEPLWSTNGEHWLSPDEVATRIREAQELWRQEPEVANRLRQARNDGVEDAARLMSSTHGVNKDGFNPDSKLIRTLQVDGPYELCTRHLSTGGAYGARSCPMCHGDPGRMGVRPERTEPKCAIPGCLFAADQWCAEHRMKSTAWISPGEFDTRIAKAFDDAFEKAARHLEGRAKFDWAQEIRGMKVRPPCGNKRCWKVKDGEWNHYPGCKEASAK